VDEQLTALAARADGVLGRTVAKIADGPNDAVSCPSTLTASVRPHGDQSLPPPEDPVVLAKQASDDFHRTATPFLFLQNETPDN
jgi:hypothetical protein